MSNYCPNGPWKDGMKLPCKPCGIDKLRAENAVLVEQNAKMREALEEVADLIGESSGVYGLHLNGDNSPWSEIEQGGRFERLYSLPEALALPDLATPAINRIKAEAYRECAEICEDSAKQFEYMARGEYGPTYDFQAIAANELAEEIAAKADELEGKKGKS